MIRMMRVELIVSLVLAVVEEEKLSISLDSVVFLDCLIGVFVIPIV
jgi:hypothetical protein